MSITLTALMKQRYDTAANWTAANPTLLAGEIGIESDTEKIKIGDGATAWNSLGYQPWSELSTYPIVNADISASAAIVDTKLATIATAGKVSNSATTATDANTASAIVARDASGNFTAGTITAALTGAASSNVLKAGDTMTGALVVPLASAATPSLTFTGDLNTGIWSPSADAVAASTAGSERLRITSAGLVGIGTSVPGKPLTIKQPDGTSALRIEQSTGETYDIYRNGSDGVLHFDANQQQYCGYKFSTTPTGGSLTPRLVITDAGNVGIGTTSPGTKLTVSEPGATDVRVRVGNINATFDYGVESGGPGFVASSQNAPYYFFINNSERARIDSSGRLLVGTSTARSNLFNTTIAPAIQLEGAGIVPSQRFLSVINNYATAGDGGGVMVLGRSKGGTVGSNTVVAADDQLGRFDFQGNDGTDFVTGATIEGYVDGTPGANDMPGRLVFSTTADGAASPTERLRITSAGLVGIGVTSPQAILSVSDGTVTGEINPFSASSTCFFGTRTNHPISFQINASEKARIDTSGRFLVGCSSARSTYYGAGISAGINVEGAGSLGGNNRAISLVFGHSAGVDGDPILYLGRTRSDSIGGTAVVQSNDQIGRIAFVGSDGTSMLAAAQIRAEIDGTPGANDMPGRIVLSTTAVGASSPTERMRITSVGNFMVGTTTGSVTSGGLFYFSPAATSEPRLLLGHATGTGSGAPYVDFFFNAASIGSITQSGTTAVAYNTTSDYRLKENVTAFTDGIARLHQLKPCRFNFIAESERLVDGFLAHEVQTIVPEAITGEKDEVDADGNPVYQGIDQSKLVPLLTAALQEAIAKIETLEQRLTAAGID